MDINKKLRLLVTTNCPNKCPMCCNNSWDFSKLPIVDRWDYEQIMLTGGEPLLMMDRCCQLLESIRTVTSSMGIYPKIYIYTAICNSEDLTKVLSYVDGIVLTPHDIKSAEKFKEFNKSVNMTKTWKYSIPEHKSLRLNLFPEIKEYLNNEDLSAWCVKDMQWIKDCPVPDGEDFRRIKYLW